MSILEIQSTIVRFVEINEMKSYIFSLCLRLSEKAMSKRRLRMQIYDRQATWNKLEEITAVCIELF